MAVNLKPFFDLNTLSPQSVLSVQRLMSAITSTYDKRHAKVNSILLELEQLTDTLTHQVEAEKTYHARMGLFRDMRSKDPYGSTAAPECNMANRAHVLGGLTHLDPRDSVKASSSFPSSVPAVTLGISKSVSMLDEVERTLRLYSHRVRFTRLQIQTRILKLESLMQEHKLANEPTAVQA